MRWDVVVVVSIAACSSSRSLYDFDHPDEHATGARRKVECVRSHGLVACRGANERGLMGNGHSGPRQLNYVAIDAIRDAIDIEVAWSESFACVLRANREVWCWGTNLFGVLGERVPWFKASLSEIDRSIAAPGRIDRLPPATSLVVDAFHICAIVIGGSVYCWGVNGHGQVADPRRDGQQAVSVPCEVRLPERALKLYTYDTQSCALLESAALICWGGALPAGDPAFEPTVVGHGVQRVWIDRERRETCMQTADRSLCWDPQDEKVLKKFFEPSIRRTEESGCTVE